MSSDEQIPVIDISGELSRPEIAKALVDAVATNGFVFVKNLGQDIPVEVLDNTFELVGP
jgi:isopenicillin N synthase-like dioxygenase